ELQTLVTAKATNVRCGFCRSTRPAACLDEVVEQIEMAVGHLYEDPAESVPYCSAEGGYLIESEGPEEILYEMGLELTCDDSGALFDAIVRRVGFEGLVPRDWARESPNSFGALLQSWQACVGLLKHGQRYFFMDARITDADDPGDPRRDPA
ncbi:HEPN-associated N-terminal domain-containing protein, partial [Archangium violaceum]